MSENLLRIEYIDLDQAAFWDKNPKKHDLDLIIASIKKYGFKDPPKFEPVLNNGDGGLVEGNGRLEALQQMHADNALEPPRGIDLVGAAGEKPTWVIPVIFGVDAKSEAMAEAYGIDHNQITIAGAGLSFDDYISMWDEVGVSQILDDLQIGGDLPVSIQEEDLSRLDTGWTEEAAGAKVTPRDSLPVVSLIPNSYGVRSMTEIENDRLQRSIKEVGLLQAIIVRPLIGTDGLYEIIDGRQRWKAAKSLGWQFIDVIIKDLNDVEAKTLSITVNKLNGEVIASKMAETLKEVRDEAGDDYVSKVSGMTKSRMDSYRGKGSYGEEIGEDGVPSRTYREYGDDDMDEIGEIITLMIPLEADDYEKVKVTLNEISTSWSEAIVELVEKVNQ